MSTIRITWGFCPPTPNGGSLKSKAPANADPTLRTRIDQYETPHDLAIAAGLTEIAALLARYPH